jgi:hypothetical protein
MAEATHNPGQAAAAKEEVKVRPTLFIGIGGTGMEILQRVRHRILAATWGNRHAPVRVSKLSDFPVAQFLHIDLDLTGTDQAGDQAKNSDIFATQKAFTEEEKVLQTLDASKYYSTDLSLDAYPHIRKWMPLSRQKFIDLKIDPASGAGQIRSLSRLYFYDKYKTVRDVINSKMSQLLSGVTNEERLRRLALDTEHTLRVVAVCSLAGGTGSGSFLDLGFLAKKLADETGVKSAVDLYVVLPGGYSGFGKERTEANGYGALMELESIMAQGVQFVENWEQNISVTLPFRPYDNVYLFDTTNVVSEKTARVQDIYDMAADSLFEDFQSEAFGKRKRSIAPNSAQHKSFGFRPKQSTDYEHLSLTYSNTTSMLGQFTIDTHLDQRKNVTVAQRVGDMLESFFGVASSNNQTSKPTDTQRDAFVRDHMFLGDNVFTVKYKYAGKAHEQFREGAETVVPVLVDELLRINGKNIIDEVVAKINVETQQIKNTGDKDQWHDKITDLKRQLERDAFKKVEAGTGIREDSVAQRRSQLLSQLTETDSALVGALWGLVDNNELGGINYTRELIEAIKDKIENAETGVLRKLEERANWFEDFSGKMQSEEMQELEKHLGQTKGFSLFGSSKQTQADTKLEQLSEAMGHWIGGHLRAVACREAIELLRSLSAWLGVKTGFDPRTNEPIWRGFIGDLMLGRQQVREVMALMQTEIAATEVAMKADHATYVVIPAPVSVISALKKEVSPADAKAWAMETFANYGGKRELFKRLGTPEDRAELIAELRSMALRKLPTEVVAPETNPLFDALRAHPDRAALFRKCLRRAMPWADANLNGDFTADKDQYSCVIGVANAKEFDKEFGAEFRKATPTEGGFNSMKISFEETGIPGKLTCYIEFSGLPFTALRQLRNWRASYDKEVKKIPVHTHKRRSMFMHPLKPTTEELMKLENDFSYFLQSVAAGVLRRRSAADEDYEIRKKGARLSIGNERLVRLDGLQAEYRDEIIGQLTHQLEKVSSAAQFGALALLYEFYVEEAYTSRVVGKDEHESIESGLGHFVCTKLHKEYLRKFNALASSGNADSPSQILERLRAKMDQWSVPIAGSEEDGYRHEVSRDARAKRAVMPEFFESGWLEQVVGLNKGEADRVAVTAGAIPMPPPPPSAAQFYVAVNGAATGPFDLAALSLMAQSRTLAPQSLVCRVGTQQWVAASTVPEMGIFFAAPPPLPPQIPVPPAFGVPGMPPQLVQAPTMPLAKFYVYIGSTPTGPFDMMAIQSKVLTQELTGHSMVWTDGMVAPQKASEVALLSSLFMGGPPPLAMA